MLLYCTVRVEISVSPKIQWFNDLTNFWGALVPIEEYFLEVISLQPDASTSKIGCRDTLYPIFGIFLA
jgi:hypothetical protein